MFKKDKLAYLEKRNVTHFNEFYLVPEYGTLSSRAKADTSTVFLNRTFSGNWCPANMESVVDIPIVNKLQYAGYFYIYHRFGNSIREAVSDKKINLSELSISLGVMRDSEYALLAEWYKERDARPLTITLDIAHAHSSNGFSAAASISKYFPGSCLILGNIASGQAIKDIHKRLGHSVHAVKIGIGGGSICSTKNTTGFHVPPVTTTIDTLRMIKKLNYSIDYILDGGIREDGDIVKATWLALQIIPTRLPMIMCGGLFAPCIDAPGEKILDADGNVTSNVYWGSASKRQKGFHKHVEGFEKTVPVNNLTMFQKMEDIKEHMQSAISYCGGGKLLDIKNASATIIK